MAWDDWKPYAGLGVLVLSACIGGRLVLGKIYESSDTRFKAQNAYGTVEARFKNARDNNHPFAPEESGLVKTMSQILEAKPGQAPLQCQGMPYGQHGSQGSAAPAVQNIAIGNLYGDASQLKGLLGQAQSAVPPQAQVQPQVTQPQAASQSPASQRMIYDSKGNPTGYTAENPVEAVDLIAQVIRARSNCTPSEAQSRVAQALRQVDKNNDGCITAQEVGAFMRN